MDHELVWPGPPRPADRRCRQRRAVVAAALATCMSLPAAVCVATAGSGDAGLASHHVAGGGFTNPGYGAHAMPPLRVALPFFLRRALSTFSPPRALAARRIGDAAQGMTETAARHDATVTWVGHSTLLVRMAGMTFLTDPVWSDAAGPAGLGPRRLVEPGLALSELPAIDFVLISHNHYDHMDLSTLERLAGPGTRFLVPRANAATLERRGIAGVTELDWWQSTRVAQAAIHCVPARHWSRRGLFDMNASLWSGWIVEAGGRRMYFAGDTAMFDGFAEIARRFGRIDLAVVPIGAYLPREMMAPSHLDPEEAVEAVGRLGADRSLAVHHGTFVLSDEALDEPPQRFLEASRGAGRGPELDWVLEIGETRPW